MSEQNLLQFNPVTPVARTEDPLTSHQAARDVTREGVRKRQADQLLALVRRHPGYTAREYDRLGLTTDMAHKRLSDLADPENGALVVRGEPRRCRFSGKTCITWWPAG